MGPVPATVCVAKLNRSVASSPKDKRSSSAMLHAMVTDWAVPPVISALAPGTNTYKLGLDAGDMMTCTLVAVAGHVVFRTHERFFRPADVNETGVNVSGDGSPTPVSGDGRPMKPERCSMT